MPKLAVLFLSIALLAGAVELPTKRFLNLAGIKVMVAAAEAEMQKRNVQVTICIVDESGNRSFCKRRMGRA